MPRLNVYNHYSTEMSGGSEESNDHYCRHTKSGCAKKKKSQKEHRDSRDHDPGCGWKNGRCSLVDSSLHPEDKVRSRDSKVKVRQPVVAHHTPPPLHHRPALVDPSPAYDNIGDVVPSALHVDFGDVTPSGDHYCYHTKSGCAKKKKTKKDHRDGRNHDPGCGWRNGRCSVVDQSLHPDERVRSRKKPAAPRQPIMDDVHMDVGEDSVYSRLSGKELKTECQSRGLPSSGNRPKLIERLETHDGEQVADDLYEPASSSHIYSRPVTPPPPPTIDFDDDDDDQSGVDVNYNTWNTTELRNQCDDRELDRTGIKSTLVARLEQDDIETGFSSPSREVKSEESSDDDKDEDYTTWSGKELKAECKHRGLPSSGKKSTLIVNLINNDDGIEPAVRMGSSIPRPHLPSPPSRARQQPSARVAEASGTRQPRPSSQISPRADRMVKTGTTKKYGTSDRLSAGEYYRDHIPPQCDDCPDPHGDRCDIRRNSELKCLLPDKDGRFSWRLPKKGDMEQARVCGGLPLTSRCQDTHFE